MQPTRTAFGIGVGLTIVSASAVAIFTGTHERAGVAAAQGRSAAQGRNGAGAGVPIVDEYYPVKSDWIGDDRSIMTIRHIPTGSCYVLVHPSGDALLPVEQERCAFSAAVER